MPSFFRACLALLLVPLSCGAALPAVQAIGPSPLACAAGPQPVHEEGFVQIGGIEQWVTINGADCHNPVILMVHGGPGNPLTPYANLPYVAWEKDFTLVQWDQRGAGRTYGRQPVDPETTQQVLTLPGLAAEGVEVAAFAARHLATRQLILFGGSWSSALSVHMAKLRPELFVAYVGTGQLVDQENTPAAYNKVLGLARAAADTRTVAALEALGTPPWTNPRSPGALRRITRVYEARASEAAPAAWWERAPAYATEQQLADYTNGEDFSWLQYVGWKGNGMASTVDLPKLGLDFRMPVFMLQGAEDLVTVPEVSRRYFDAIRAPEKAYVLLPRVGHDPNPPMVAAQYELLMTRVKPLLR